MSGFSLLLPTYHADDPEHVERAFISAVQQQQLPPSEVVLVRDGQVPAALDAMLNRLVDESPVPVVRVNLDQNVGLGHALDAGLSACTYDLVARMDSDDISLPNRFSVQIPLLDEGYDLVGSGLLEFGDDEDDIVGLRTPPTDEAEIKQWARFADPFNHPTVVYRRRMVQARRRLPRPAADGGLLAVRPNDRTWSHGSSTSRSHWSSTGSGLALTDVVAGGRCCGVNGSCNGGSAPLDS